MKILKYLFFLLLIAIIAVSVYVAVQPSDFEVARTRTINLPSSIIYNNLNDYKNWEEWGPWQEEDPTMTFNYPENTSGKGGSYNWEGKDGKGKMETISVSENSSIDQKLTFEDFEPSDVYWKLNETENGTEVTWGMKGKKNFMFKLFTTFMGSMEKTVGPMYERGLEKLDSILVVSTKKYSIEVEGLTEYSGSFYIYNTTSSKLDEADRKMQEMLPKVGEFAIKNNISIAGVPFTYYHKWDEENNATIFSCGIPTAEKIITTDNDIQTGELKPFKAVKTVLKGDYSNLKEAWETAIKYINDNNLVEIEDGAHLEVYRTDPGQFPNPADWITEIYISVKSE